MHRVMRHIDEHLDAQLELDSLAAVANFSAFHFHRLFTAWMGETVGDYTRRRRLEMAAQRMVAQPRVPVTQVALSVGFGSSEAFARAFKTRFGSSPTPWRDTQVRNRDQVNRNLDQAAAPAGRNDGRMKVTIVERQPTNVAYLRQIGAVRQTDLRLLDANGRSVDGDQRPLREATFRNQPRRPGHHRTREVALRRGCRSSRGLQRRRRTPDGHGPGRQVRGRPFKGDDREIGEAWTWMLRDWLPGSGMQLDSRPFFEHYPVDAGCDTKTGVFECEICIPVAPL